MDKVIAIARAFEAKRDVDSRVGFAAWTSESIAIFPSYNHATSLEDMQVPVALVELEATVPATLVAIALALKSIGEL